MSEWIRVKDSLPEKGATILAWDKMFSEINFVDVIFEPEHLDSDYTHWMPLPEPPAREVTG